MIKLANLGLILIFTIGFLCLFYGSSMAFEAIPDWDRLANAIYKAEGGLNTNYPYGIMVKYKHTTPRQACINTCKHKYRDWVNRGSSVDWLSYLASKYAPIGVDNDPKNLNKNWLNLVKYFYSLNR